MAREHRHGRHKSHRSGEHHKSRKTGYVVESPILQEPMKISKPKRTTPEESKTSQHQKFMLDEAQIQMLAEQIAQLQATTKTREAAPVAKASSRRVEVDQSAKQATASKPKKTVSIAGIFRKSSHRTKEKKSKSPSPEEGLLCDFHGESGIHFSKQER